MNSCKSVDGGGVTTSYIVGSKSCLNRWVDLGWADSRFLNVDVDVCSGAGVILDIDNVDVDAGSNVGVGAGVIDNVVEGGNISRLGVTGILIH